MADDVDRASAWEQQVRDFALRDQAHALKGVSSNLGLVKLAADSKVGTWVPAGAVTVGFGGNTWAGGDNTLPFDRSLSLPGSTVTLDGKAIVEKGELKL